MAQRQAEPCCSTWAYAPYGEIYAKTGGGSAEAFTGQYRDIVGDEWDFLYRQEHSSQGRWISPDPAGLAAADPENPQTWNRYAYVGGNPLANLDPTGLVTLVGCGVSGTCMGAGWSDPFFTCGWFGYCDGGGTTPMTPPDVFRDPGPLVSKHQKSGANNVDCSNPPAVPPAPLGVDIDFNIQLVQNAAKDVGGPFGIRFGNKVALVYDLYQTGGPFDFKQQGPQFTDFGNFNFGAGCAAALGSSYLCQSAAGLNRDYRAFTQGKPFGSGIPFITPPFGDQKTDNQQIQNGAV